MDATDRRIIELLKEDGRMPLTEIGSTIGMPDTSVHFRVQRMKDSGIIKGFTVITNLGLELKEVEGFDEFVEAAQKTIEGQRKETDLLWAAVKACAHRLDKLDAEKEKEGQT